MKYFSHIILLVAREPRVLSGRSLQVLSKYIERGLTLGVHLQLKDSVISGIAFDSLSKRSTLHEVTYRVLLQWKRAAHSAFVRNRREQNLTVGLSFTAKMPLGQSMFYPSGSSGNLASLQITGEGATRSNQEIIVQELIAALQSMDLEGLSAAVAFSFANDLELTDSNVQAGLLGALPLRSSNEEASTMNPAIINDGSSAIMPIPPFDVHQIQSGGGNYGMQPPSTPISGPPAPMDKHVRFEQISLFSQDNIYPYNR